MKKNQDTLFSIKNEELRKRKYSLLAMRLTFIIAFFNIFPLISDILHKEYLQQIIAPFLWIGIICLMLLAMNYLYFLSFFIIAAFMVYVKWYTITYDFVLPYVEELLCVCSIFSVIPAWKVCTFFRRKIVKVKIGTLFSIKKGRVKKERKFSLLILRVLFIFESLALVCGLLNLDYFFPDTTNYDGILPALCIYSALVILKLWFLWKLEFRGFYMVEVICIFSFIFPENSFWKVALPLVVESILLIASWRVHSFLRKQAKEPFTQEAIDCNNSTTVSPISEEAPKYVIEKTQPSVSIKTRIINRLFPLARSLFLFLLNAGIFIFCIQRMEFRFAEILSILPGIALTSLLFGLFYLFVFIDEIKELGKDILDWFKEK